MSIYARLIAIAAIALALAAGAWKCYNAGQDNIRAAWTAEKLATSENARLRERAAQVSNERIEREYQNQKARAAADKRIVDDRLRDFAAASGSTVASAPGGTDDPYRAIARECAAALGVLDGYAQSVAAKATALQEYSREVCLSK
jgi:hypothetical protein